MDEETNSIDKSVREVVKAHVEEVVTEMVDQKVADTLVEMKDELTKEKLIELLTGDAIKEVVNSTDFEGSITAGDIDTESVADSIEFATENYVDNAVENHSHDSYDLWNQIDSYVYEALSDAISEHTSDEPHGGSHGSDGKLQKNFESVLNLIGIIKSDDSMMVTNSPSGWAHKPDGPNTILARIKKLEDKTAGIGTSISPTGADPRIDQLMAWAQHVDNILKAAAESTVLNQEVPA